MKPRPSKRRPFKRLAWVKRHLPKSLFGRALLIIMLPIAIMQIIVAYIFFDAHWQTVTASLSDSVAAEISLAVELYEQAPTPERIKQLDDMLRPNMQLSVALESGRKLPTANRNAFFSTLDKTLRRALSANLDHNFWFDTTRYPHHIDIRVQVDGGVLRFIVPRERVFAPTGYIFLFWMIMATVFLSLVSILFILNQARPIVKLADAAEKLGKGQGIGNFKPSGAREVRQAGAAFLNMRERILRHIQQRTDFLAGVSHDLRTPLTRLKLHLAMSGNDEDVVSARRDVNDMEKMLDGYLDFARNSAQEEVEATSLNTLLAEIVEAAPEPKPALTADIAVTLSMRAMAIKRALSNIIANAQSYGRNTQIELIRQSDGGEGDEGQGSIEIIIDDDGPGIDPALREEAFKPFNRLDNARNQNVKGVGLGLSIAQDIIQSHGGSIQLTDSPLGGLRCIVHLPG